MKDTLTVGRGLGLDPLASELASAYRDGVRSFEFRCVDFDWNVPVSLDDTIPVGTADTLSLKGAGLIKTVLHRTFTEPKPALSARSCWLSHWTVEGVTWIENASPVSAMISLAYTDRWYWNNASIMGGVRGLELGVGGTLTGPQVGVHNQPDVVPGIAGEFCISGRSEFTSCQEEGLYIYGARNFLIGGRTSFERNARANTKLYPEVSIIGHPGVRCGHGSIRDVAFENDDTKVGLYLYGLQGMHVGANRHVLAGMYANCNDSTWYRSVVYGNAPMNRIGQRNQWPGRGYRLTGSWYNKALELEPESEFDLHLPVDGSGT